MGRPKRSAAKTVTKSRNAPPLSVEEKEELLRQERAKETKFRITVQDREHFPFSTYEVAGDTKVCYVVEVRSLMEKTNSCSCPDFHVNTLGTCKHIEGALNFIRSKDKRKLKQLALAGSKRLEIFLNPNTQEAHVQWPRQDTELDPAFTMLQPYMSVNQQQLVNATMGTLSIENVLKEASPEIAAKIRLSQHLVDWAQERQHFEVCQNDRKQFLADVKSGKRSLQMLSHRLLPYQEQGMLHLAFSKRAILADEMGLGKTIQAIAASELLRRLNRAKRVVVVTPASLKGEWEEQIERFVGLPTLIVQGSRPNRLAAYKQDVFFYLVSYEQVRSDHAEIQSILSPDIMILDEAQRIKNWPSKTSWAVKQIKTPYAFVLSGTPIENRIDEIYSIMQVVDARVLGPLFKFQQDFYRLDDNGKPAGYKNLDELHRKLQPVLLRRRKKDVEEQLPERTINNFLVPLVPEQAVRYKEFSDEVAVLVSVLKKRPLTAEEQKKLQRLLACMRMVSDTPYILDDKCRECPKLEELEEILTELLAGKDNKIIIFSEWERMLFLVRDLVDQLGVDYAWHSGSISQTERRGNIKRFKEDPCCRIFLTTDSGSTGLNLQVANVVINCDLPWNPAKLEQRIARAWRKNQTRVVQVINLVSTDTIEHRMLSVLAVKQAVADVVLDAVGDFTEMPLPSASRSAFIERLEELTGNSSLYQAAPRAKKSLESPDELKQDILARHSDRIHLLAIHNGDKLLAVVDKVDSTITESLSEGVQGDVEILDFETFATLKRLSDAGIIQFAASRQVLFQSSLLHVDQRRHCRGKLEQANIHFAEADHKLRMVSLLRSGGFGAEAIPAAREVFHKGMDTLKALDYTPGTEALQLREQVDDVQDPEAFIDLLAKWMEEISITLTQYALGTTCEKTAL